MSINVWGPLSIASEAPNKDESLNFPDELEAPEETPQEKENIVELFPEDAVKSKEEVTSKETKDPIEDMPAESPKVEDMDFISIPPEELFKEADQLAAEVKNTKLPQLSLGENIPLRVLKFSPNKRVAILSKGQEDGFSEGMHIKIFHKNKQVARGKLLKNASSKSLWQFYEIYDQNLWKPNFSMVARRVTPIEVTPDPDRVVEIKSKWEKHKDKPHYTKQAQVSFGRGVDSFFDFETQSNLKTDKYYLNVKNYYSVRYFKDYIYEDYRNMHLGADLEFRDSRISGVLSSGEQFRREGLMFGPSFLVSNEFELPYTFIFTFYNGIGLQWVDLKYFVNQTQVADYRGIYFSYQLGGNFRSSKKFLEISPVLGINLLISLPYNLTQTSKSSLLMKESVAMPMSFHYALYAGGNYEF